MHHKKAAAEHKKNEREAKKLLPRIEEEIEKAVRSGRSSVRVGFVDDKLHSAVSSLLWKKGYRCGTIRVNYSDDYGLTDELEISWGDDHKTRIGYG